MWSTSPQTRGGWGDDASRRTCGFAIRRPSPRMDAWNSRTTRHPLLPSRGFGWSMALASRLGAAAGLKRSSISVEAIPGTRIPMQLTNDQFALIKQQFTTLKERSAFLRRQVRRHRPLRRANPGRLREAAVLREGRSAQRLPAGPAGRARRGGRAHPFVVAAPRARRSSSPTRSRT